MLQGSQLAIDSHSLSKVASLLVSRIPHLLHRIRDLENEEAELDARARQLVQRLEMTNQTRSTPTDLTPVAKPPVRRAVVSRTLPLDPRDIETPMKAFLLRESFALAMSVKSKRKGRVFLGGESTEFGERRDRVGRMLSQI